MNSIIKNLIKPFVAPYKPINFEVEPKEARIKFSYTENGKVVTQEGLATDYLKKITDFLNK